MDGERPELFHRLDEESSARVRRWAVDHGLAERLWFRNVIYPAAEAAFRAHGGTSTPALWAGGQLFAGAELIIARLEALLDIGRSGD